MQPVHVQIREDQAFGAAWRRLEAAAQGEGISITRTHSTVDKRYVATTLLGEPRDGYAYADSPVEAMLLLAEKLERIAEEAAKPLPWSSDRQWQVGRRF